MSASIRTPDAHGEGWALTEGRMTPKSGAPRTCRYCPRLILPGMAELLALEIAATFPSGLADDYHRKVGHGADPHDLCAWHAADWLNGLRMFWDWVSSGGPCE